MFSVVACFYFQFFISALSLSLSFSLSLSACDCYPNQADFLSLPKINRQPLYVCVCFMVCLLTNYLPNTHTTTHHTHSHTPHRHTHTCRHAECMLRAAASVGAGAAAGAGAEPQPKIAHYPFLFYHQFYYAQSKEAQPKHAHH